jgi:transcriptional regulator
METGALLPGTLDLLILRSLEKGSRHGYAVASWIKKTSQGLLEVGEGALYPALHRMRLKGWVETEWGLTETKRRAKFYHLTKVGREQLNSEVSRWSQYSEGVSMILDGR